MAHDINTIPFTDTLTRSAYAEQLAEIGLPADQVEAIVDATAPDRHAARKFAVGQAVAARMAAEPRDRLQREALEYVATYADIVGVGGYKGCGNALRRSGSSSPRLPVFSELGSGRRAARDGRAWSAAIQEVFDLRQEEGWFLGASTDGQLSVHSKKWGSHYEVPMELVPLEYQLNLSWEMLSQTLASFEVDRLQAKAWSLMIERLQAAVISGSPVKGIPASANPWLPEEIKEAFLRREAQESGSSSE